MMSPMPMRADQNAALAGLLDELGWKHGQFARAINSAGTRAGLRLKYDESSVSHWLNDGTLPRRKTQDLILVVLARGLGRPVTAVEAGFATTSAVVADADTLTGLAELGRADMDPSRRALMGVAGLYAATMAIPGWQEATSRFKLIRANPHTRIGMREVEAVAAMTEQVSALDDQFGGRFARPMAAAFLVNTIVPYLHAEATDEVRTAMLSAASDHCYLTGYMAMDERLDGLADRYYAKALELAAAAGDRLTFCTTLRGMSVMHGDLGDGATALRLADDASSASPQASPRMRAFLAGQQAHAAAIVGDRAVALQRIGEAESSMEKAESQAKAFGSYDPSALNYHISQVRYELGDLNGSIRSMEESHRLREPIFRRTRVRYGAMLAERQFEAGRIEEACVAWHRALDDFPLVQSARCHDRIDAMLAMTGPFHRNTHVRELRQRATEQAR
ncbi:tetratricopeptide repeat protein [Kitasatospora sp. NPDC059795]|uniref:tetratricopeptide repeat protein n=1 Tax=Kitasatospora sp. NPDC059795 TaxID=3346949 RepID=UPI003658D9BE